MYSVYADDTCIYDGQSPLTKVKVLNPNLSLEDSAAGSFEMTLLPGSVGYDAVEPMVTTITVKQDGEELWSGRVLSYDEDFYKQRKMYCEGELAYLNDTCQEPTYYQNDTVQTFLGKVLDVHNSKVDAKKKFYLGMVTVQDDTGTLLETGFEKTMETVNKLVERLGGHLRIRKTNGKRYLDYLKDYPNTATQIVKFGKNLVDFTRSFDYSELATVILPMGKPLEVEQMRVDVNLPISPGSVIDPETGEAINGGGPYSYVDLGTNYPANYVTAYLDVEEGETYYYSGMATIGKGAYAIFDQFGDPIQIEKAPDDGYREYKDTEIHIPNGGDVLVVASMDQSGYNPLKLTVDGVPEKAVDQYVTVKSVSPDNSYYVKSSTLMSTYGWIEKSMTWENIDDPADLYSKALQYLTDNQFDGMTIEANAIDLHLLDSSTPAFKLLDQVRIVSEPHGIDKLFPVTAISLPLADPANVKYTFGNEKNRSLTGINNSINSDIFDALKAIVPKEELLNAAKTNATELIRNAALTNGYVTLVKSPNSGKTSEILVADDENYLTAQKVWRWNINGLGYSNTGYNGEYGLAMTMDGSIVADRITAGTMYADRIKGGTLTLGGVNNEFGVLTVLNRTGDAVGSWDKAGLFTQGRIVSYKQEASVEGGGNLDSQSDSSITAIYGSRLRGYVGDVSRIENLPDDDIGGDAAQSWGELLLVDKDEKNLQSIDRLTTLRGFGAVMLRGDSGIVFRIGTQMVLINGWTIDNGIVTLRGRADWIVNS